MFVCVRLTQNVACVLAAAGSLFVSYARSHVGRENAHSAFPVGSGGVGDAGQSGKIAGESLELCRWGCRTCW